MKSKIISISKGAQFRDGKAVYLFILLIFILAFLVFNVVYERYMMPLLVSPLVILFTFFILDIRGVDIDKSKNRIRSYKLNVWGKSGKWKSLHGFKLISLDHQSFTVKVRSFYSNAINVRDSYNHEEHGHFITTLVHENKDESIILTEHINYNKAKEEAVKISKKTGFTLDDVYREKMIGSKRNRGK